MKINEVEALVGITKKNIRFYEEQGLLSPRRNSQNGYRDYGEAEVDALRRIKLLRKLGVPLEEIRQMQSGVHTVGDGMRRHLVSLERERQNLADAARLCAELTDSHERLDHLDAEALLIRMAGLIWLFLWSFDTDPAGAPPLPLLALLVAIPAAVILGVVVALVQRIHEIGRGEEDDAKKY